jgi:1-acyl-sn-glycerol-3-phosphate acyltransferase
MDKWKLKPARDLGLSVSQRRQSVHRESGLLESGTHLAWALAVRFYLHFWHRLKVQGSEHLPRRPPFVLVANHASHLDALVLAAPLPLTIRDRVFALAAGDVFFEKNLKASFATSFINALPLWRRKITPKAMVELRRRLVDEPCAFILFPEGGRSRDGQMMPFKAGIGMLLAETNVPVVPCYLEGTFEACPAERTVPLRLPIRLRAGPPLSFAEVPDKRAGWEEVATRLEEAVRRLGPNLPSQITTSSVASGGF